MDHYRVRRHALVKGAGGEGGMGIEMTPSMNSSGPTEVDNCTRWLQAEANEKATKRVSSFPQDKMMQDSVGFMY